MGIEHIGPAHDDAQLAVLKETARQQLHAGHEPLDLTVAPGTVTTTAGADGVLVAGMRSQVLWQVPDGAYTRLGFDAVGDKTLRALVLGADHRADLEGRHPTWSMWSLSRRRRCAPSSVPWGCIERDYRDRLAKACLAHSAQTAASQASLVLYDVVLRDRDRRQGVGSRSCGSGIIWPIWLL